MATMTRMKLINILYGNHGFNRTEAKRIVDAFFEELCKSLSDMESVKISGFGSFYVQSKKERMGRNPKTGEEFKIERRSVVRFRVSNKLRQKIDKKTQNDADLNVQQSDVTSTDDAFQFITE